MGNTKWTIEQQNAIDTKKCNLLVAAAAGAGKTAVLVERIVRMITDQKNPVDIDKLLVVTFTNAAASEMREKIADSISKEIEKNPDSERLQRQIALLSKSNIITIHSFCLEVIRNNFHLTDLDPSFRIVDGTESILIKQETIEEMFDNKYEDENCRQDFLNLVDCYGGGRDDRNLQDIVLLLYEFAQSMPWPEEWLTSTAEMFNVNDDFTFGTSIWAKAIIESVTIELKGICSMMEEAVLMLKESFELNAYYIMFSKDTEEIKSILKCDTWEKLSASINYLEFERLPSCRKVVDKELQEKVKDIRSTVKDQIKSIKDDIISSKDDEIIKSLRNLYPHMRCLSNLAVEFGNRYRAQKKEKGVIDFNDIEHYCIDILVEKRDDGSNIASEIAIKYREKFEEILIDEYQDSNKVQELILSVISRKESGNPNMFMVGDVKQSIYRFRQAEPKLFLDKYSSFGDSGSERKILLNKNFRSREGIIDAVNFIFKSIMSSNIGEIDYSDDEKLNYGANYPELKDGICAGPIEVNIMETLNADKLEDNSKKSNMEKDESIDEKDLDEEDLDSIQLEARMVANRISEILSKESHFMVYSEDKLTGERLYRKVEYRDIVILMRSVSSYAAVFVQELSERGIPVYADSGGGYFEVVEVQTIMSLLQIIDNPMQDIPLIAVLRSPIGNFTPEELIDIRIAGTKVTFYEALKEKFCQNDGELSEKLGKFLDNLNRWREKSRDMPISEFLWYLYTDTGYFAYARAMPGGELRQANLRILFERARQYEEISFKGLFNFINFINKLKKSSGDMGSAKILGENENVVRIMSIHKSKGLEFPVVIVSGLGRKFNQKDLEKAILFHHELGFGPDYVDIEKRLSYPTTIKKALKKKMKLESYSEEMRILYVAMTRAKEKLILTGTVGNIKKALGRWSQGANCPGNKVPEYHVLSGKNYLDWICPALLKHSECNEFRNFAESYEISSECIIDDPSLWQIKLWNMKDVVNDNKGDKDSEAVDMNIVRDRGKYTHEIDRRLSFEYTYKMSLALPAKLSVTELKRMGTAHIEDEYSQNIFIPQLAKRPVFLEDIGKISPAEKGTIMHLVMRHLTLAKIPDAKVINEIMDDMVSKEFITKDQKALVDIDKIICFFEGNLGQRLLKSGNVNREVPFYIEIKATEVYNNLSEDVYGNEYIILQGIIDCYFEEDDGIVLIDYKTDYVPKGGSETIKEKYNLQIEYYTRALQKLTGKIVKEKYLYLFYNGQIIKYL